MNSDFATPLHVRVQSKVWLNEFNKSMFGLDDVAKLCLVALVTGGHVLLEGNPGLGKTELVKTLKDILGLDYGRIQFTPDLMPSDITGTLHPTQEDGTLRLQFKKGPILGCNLLLADEINRATPKTQAAMLEAMAEWQVTVLGEKHETSSPFMVLATQNPLEHEGTYPLPEALLDRFMFKILMPFPSEQTVKSILAKRPQAKADARAVNVRNTPVKKRADVENIGEAVHEVKALPNLEEYIVNLVTMLGGRSASDSLKEVRDFVRIGPGPRAGIALMNGAKAWRLLFEDLSDYACERDLARIALPVLRHRIHLHFDWRERATSQLGTPPTFTEEEARDAVLLRLCQRAAPITKKDASSWEEFTRGLPEHTRQLHNLKV